MRCALQIFASRKRSFPWLGAASLGGKLAAWLALRACESAGSCGIRESVMYWSTSVQDCWDIVGTGSTVAASSCFVVGNPKYTVCES